MTTTKATPARLDSDRTARPLTRLVGHARPGDVVGPGITRPDHLETVATGERIPVVVSLACDACGSPLDPHADKDQILCSKCRSTRSANDRQEGLEVGRTILAQLGGNRFIAMTGAKQLSSHARGDGSRGGLSFRMPTGFASTGVNHVRIDLRASDTYTMTFTKIGRAPGYRVTTIAKVEDVYDVAIRAVFEKHTGLTTTMPVVTRGGR